MLQIQAIVGLLCLEIQENKLLPLHKITNLQIRNNSKEY